MYCIYEEVEKKFCCKWEDSNATIPTTHRSSFWGLSINFVCLKNTSKTVSQTACLADTQDNAGNV